MTNCILIGKEIDMKKSYMDRKNILNEGFFNMLRKYLVQYPALKKDKKVTNNIKNLNNKVSDLEKVIAKRFKDLGVKKKVKLSKYNLKDFI